jgi:hypothetical protein
MHHPVGTVAARAKKAFKSTIFLDVGAIAQTMTRSRPERRRNSRPYWYNFVRFHVRRAAVEKTDTKRRAGPAAISSFLGRYGASSPAIERIRVVSVYFS